MEIGAIVTIIAFTLGCLAIPVMMGFGIWLNIYTDRKKYNQKVPGYGLRMAKCPYDAKLVSKVLADTVDTWNKIKKHDKATLNKKLKHLRIEWLRGTKEDDGAIKRYIVDSWGRKIAGDHDGNKLRVVYLDTDKIGNTAFVHEICHEFKELDGNPDGTHSDVLVWGGKDETGKKVTGVVNTVKAMHK